MTTVRLPVALALSLTVSVASAGGVYAVMQYRLTEGELRDARTEKRVEKLEDTASKTQLLLERIDERTAEIKRQIDLRRP